MTDSPPRAWNYPVAGPPPLCPHGTAYAQPCYSCGWTCPTCKRSYAPWVRECNYKHEETRHVPSVFGAFPPVLPVPGPGMPANAVMHIALPPEWSEQGYRHFIRACGEWREVTPGLQVLLGQPVSGGEEAILHFRLAPPDAG